MSNKTLLDSLDRDEALGFFEGGIPGADNVISQEVKNSDDSEQAPKTVDPRKNPNFNKPVEDLDFEISDLIRENIPEVLEDDRIDYTKNDEEDEDEDEEDEDSESNLTNSISYKSFIDAGILKPFEDTDEVNTEDDFKELLTANLKNEYDKGKDEGLKSIYDNIPEKLKTVLEYAMKGGKDIDTMFNNVRAKESLKELDLENERDQEEIVRQVLMSQDLTEDEIQEEIESYKDLDSLKRIATKFKPRLDKIKEKSVEDAFQKQEELVKKSKEQAAKYTESISEALSGEDLYGYKVDSSLKEKLINGMSNLVYPSISGKNTNLLGKLLEKYQIEEPDMERVMAATLVLLDPKEFFKDVNINSKKEVEKDTLRRIKNVNTTPTTTTSTGGSKNSKQKRTNNFYSPL